MSKNDKDTALPRHSEPQPGASVLLRSNDGGDLTISFSDGSDALTMNRRDFMRVSGVAAATAAMSSAACREPQREIVPYVDRPEEVRIGNPNEYASICEACPSQCGIRVKTRSGRPIKLEGNDKHPLSQGGLCGRGQASYMDLYDPDRLREPVDADGQSMSWDDVDSQVQQAVDDGASVRILTGHRSGPATQGLIDDIVDGLSDAAHYTYEPLSDHAVAAASETAYGDAVVPHYHFDRADYVLSLGSDFLGTWLSPVEFTRDFASGRDFFDAEQSFDERLERFRDDIAADVTEEYLEEHDEEPDDDQLQQLVEERLEDIDLEAELDFAPEMNRFVAFEPAMTLTGINADDRYRVHPERLVYIALGIAHELFENHNPGGLPAGAVQSALQPFDVESVAQRLSDVDADVLRNTAAELADHAGRSIVVAGGMSSASADGIALESAVNLINAALENDGQTIDRARPSNQSTTTGSDELVELIGELEAGAVDVLIIDDTNPVYASPANLDVASAIEEADLVISTADRVDETAQYADIVAAGTHYLEAWGDASPKTGLMALRQPAILPLYENRSFEDSLLHWFGTEQQRPELAGFLDTPEPPQEDGGQRGEGKPYDAGPFYRYLRDYWENEVFENADTSATFQQFWLDTLRDGHFEDDSMTSEATDIDASAVANALPGDFADSDDADTGDLSAKTVHLYTTIPMYDGRQANNGHLQEMPEPITKHTWGSFAMVGYATFEAAGLESGQVLEIDTDGGTLEFPVICVPGMHEDVISLPVGYGRTAAGTVGDDVGANAFRIADVDDGVAHYSGLSATVRATDEVRELPVTQQGDVLDVDYRRILATASLDEYSGDQSAGVYHTPVEYSLWEDHDFGDLKWGMSIDMTKCTGCSACVVACQEENNIPVVGRQGVIEGREMHWLRLDRYYRLPEEGVEAREGLIGDPMYEDEPLIAFGEFFDQPRVINQPMLCQHCDKAPCESVCPVVATMQSDDGLNQMSYQRCIGTRYCSNNCPYKVRRFNWFNYAENREDSIFARLYPELEEHGRLNQEEPLNLAFNPDVTVRSRGVMEKCTFCVQRIRRGKWEIAKEGRRDFREGEVVTACQESCPADAIEFGNMLDEEQRVARLHKRNRAMYALSDLDTQPAVAYMTSVWNTDEELT